MPDVASLLNGYVLAYVVVVVGAQLALFGLRRREAERLRMARARAGLDDNVLVDHAETLRNVRAKGLTDAIVLNVTIFLTPFALVALSKVVTPAGDATQGLALAFAALVIWALVSGTDVARAFLGGIAFRTYAAFRHPFQIGDRVTLGGHAGKVRDIGPFYVFLETFDDDLVAVPTASLWTTPLVSANAGDRASLCVITFYLAPLISAADRRKIEDHIWDTVQLSTYWDSVKPMQIYVEQTEDAIVLAARAYVALTYNEFLFKSEVTRAVLDFADEQNIPLASRAWKRTTETVDG